MVYRQEKVFSFAVAILRIHIGIGSENYFHFHLVPYCHLKYPPQKIDFASNQRAHLAPRGSKPGSEGKCFSSSILDFGCELNLRSQVTVK